MRDTEPRTERIPAERLTRVLALFAASTTLLPVVGWITREPRLVQPVSVFAAGRPWTLLVILLASTGVWAHGAGRAVLARRAAVLTSGATLIGMMANVSGWVLPLSAWAQSRVSPTVASPPIGGIAITSGALFLTIAVCTWLLSRAMPSVRRVVAVAAATAIVMTVSGVLWLVQASSVLESSTVRGLIQTSMPSLVAAMLLSGALLRRVASAERFALAPPRWSPAVAGVLVALVVVGLWRSLESREAAQLTARAQIASDALQRAIDRQFFAIQSAVRRLALFTASAGPGTEQFGRTVERLAAETDGIERLLLMDPRGNARRVAPNDGAVVVTSALRAQIVPLLASVPAQAPGAVEHAGTVFGLDDSRWGLAVAQPVWSTEDGLTAVVALLDERGLLAPFTSDTSAGFIARAFVRDSQIVGPPIGHDAPALTSTIRFGSRAIRLTLTPLASALPSSLPDLVLVLGLAIAVLVALTLWLARKTFEQASAVGMTRMQQAIDRATDGVWELDVLASRMHRSDALLRYLGLEPSAINGPWAAWTARTHPDDVAVVDAALRDHLAGRTDAFECEYRVRAGDDTWHTLLDRGRVVERALDGRPQRLLGISADTTERARADAAREESERRFRTMFDTAYQLQLLLDLDGRVLEANRAAAELAGLSVDALQGQDFAALAWWPSDPLTQGRVQERVTRASTGDSSRFEVELVGAGKRHAIVDFSLKPILDQQGNAVQVLAEGRDLTERKRTEASLREIGALTTMGQLAARVAHDINNPLAGIQNAFLLVRGAIPTDHPHYRFVGAIEREIARIAAVTRQLYETYRPDQAMGSSSSVILAVSDAVIFLEQVNRARGIRIVTDVARAPSLVPVPDALLRQTLYNLVQNALDATPAGGTITVTVLVESSWCIIRVTDEGPGIPDALRERIFDPFFSTKDRSVKTGGMGIGLSLVRQSVLAVGGEILVHNREHGGTMFDVRFPMTPIDTGVLR